MKIAFISLLEDVSIPGFRYLSAYLRARGHDTILILLPWSFTDRTLNECNSFLYPYPDKRQFFLSKLRKYAVYLT